MKTFKTIIKIVLFFFIFIFLNGIVAFFLVPANNVADNVSKSYRETKNIDRLFVGSSLVYCAFNPYIFDEEMNCDSFNMATPTQLMPMSYSFLQTAIEDHQIKQVCLNLWYGALKQKTYESKTTMLLKKDEIHIVSFPTKIKKGVQFIFQRENFKSVDSLLFFFPWVYDYTPRYPSAIFHNVKSKISGKIDTPGGGLYQGKGYWSYDSYIDYNEINRFSRTDESGAFSDTALIELDKICILCKKNNVDLILFGIPFTVYDVLAWKDEYFDKLRQLEDFLGERGYAYYDFNLIKPEIFKSQEHFFKDYQHLNSVGAEAFSHAFATFLKKREAGEDVKQYFYTPEEWIASIDFISAVFFDVKKEEGKIKIQAEAYTGSNVQPEYQFLLQEDQTKEYIVLRDYSEESNFSFTPNDDKRKLRIHVNARIKKSQQEWERFYEKEIEF